MPGASTEDDANFGKPEAELTAQVDVAAYTEQKRAAMRAHASQISEESFFLAMPDDVFAYVVRRRVVHPATGRAPGSPRPI